MRTLPVALAALGCALALPAAAYAAYDLGSHPDGVLEGTSTACAGRVHDRPGLERERAAARARAGSATRASSCAGASAAAAGRRGCSACADGRAARRARSPTTDPVQLTGVLQELPAALPVRAGDAIGLALTAGASRRLGRPRLRRVDADLGAGARRRARAAASRRRGRTIAFQAVLEPDADADGLGDETQDCVRELRRRDPTPPEPAPGDPDPDADPPPADPYAELRTRRPEGHDRARGDQEGHEGLGDRLEPVRVRGQRPPAAQARQEGRRQGQAQARRQRHAHGVAEGPQARQRRSRRRRRCAGRSASRARRRPRSSSDEQARQERRRHRRHLPRHGRRRRLGDGDQRTAS